MSVPPVVVPVVSVEPVVEPVVSVEPVVPVVSVEPVLPVLPVLPVSVGVGVDAVRQVAGVIGPLGLPA
ncbi:MAG: hypothetical protein ACTHJL_07905, partial [Amnibacterium sp.]